MDKIHIKDLEIIAFHGAIQEEKVLGQKFVLTFELDVDLRQAGKNDDLTKTVSSTNRRGIYKDILWFNRKSSWRNMWVYIT